MGADFLPKLCAQAGYQKTAFDLFRTEADDMAQRALRQISQRHKAAILGEIRRQEEAEVRRKREIRDQIEQTKLRRERREALREAYRLRCLTQAILSQVIAPAHKTDYNPSVPVYDIRQ